MKYAIFLAAATASFFGGSVASPVRRNGTDFPNPYPTAQLIANLTAPITKSVPQIKQIMAQLPQGSTQEQQQAAINQMEDVLETQMAFYWVGQALSMANAIASAGYNSTTPERSINKEFAKGLLRLNSAAPSTVMALGQEQASQAWQAFTIPYNSLIEQLSRTDKSLVSDLKVQIKAHNATISTALGLTNLT